MAEPSAAVALPGADAVLVRLAARFGQVAVVSGRPVPFLVERLPRAAASAVELVGLYGLEVAGPDGVVRSHPEVARWQGAVDEAADLLAAAAPPGVLVERKGASVTVHWRADPGCEPWVRDAVGAEAGRSGLAAHPARASLELRPPVAVDKGTVVEERCAGMVAACYLGDDVGDVPAFAALRRWAAATGAAAVGVAAEDEETDPTVRSAADVVVPGPAAVLAILDWLAGAAPSGAASADT